MSNDVARWVALGIVGVAGTLAIGVILMLRSLGKYTERMGVHTEAMVTSLETSNKLTQHEIRMHEENRNMLIQNLKTQDENRRLQHELVALFPDRDRPPPSTYTPYSQRSA